MAFVAVLSTGCFPLMTSYVHIEGPAVSHPLDRCGGSLPPYVARHEGAGAMVDVRLDPSFAPRVPPSVVVRAPHGMAVSIPSPNALLKFDGRPDEHIVILSPREPTRFERPPNHPGIKPSTNAAHYFALTDLPELDAPGTIELPAIRVGDAVVPPMRLHFGRRPFASIAPLNC